MSWQILLTFSHIIGTVLGVGGATFAEFFYLKALKDGHIDPEEGDFLKATYHVLRIGIALLILSGFGFFVLYRINGHEAFLYDPRFLAKVTLTAIIFFNALLLQIKRIPFWLGSALSFTSWYGALILGAWRGVDASYFTIIASYAGAVLVVALILHIIRKIYLKPLPPTSQ